MIPFLFLYGGSRSVVFDGNCDILHHRSARVIIIHIILLAVFVFLGGQLEELDQTKAQWHQP
jgi:hypothetical protein